MANEKRLIDAYALMNQVRESKFNNPHTESKIARNHMFEHDHFTKLICLSPTVDAVEVVHGEWNPIMIYEICSKCGYEINRGKQSRTAFVLENRHCRYCGAKMDLEG